MEYLSSLIPMIEPSHPGEEESIQQVYAVEDEGIRKKPLSRGKVAESSQAALSARPKELFGSHIDPPKSAWLSQRP